MPKDLFASHGDSPHNPAEYVFQIAPSNDPLPFVVKGIRAGATGTVTIRCLGDNATETVHPVLDGEIIPARITHVTACEPANMPIIGYS